MMFEKAAVTQLLFIQLIKKSPASGESTGFASDNSFLLNQWIPGLLPNNKGNNRRGNNNGEIRSGGWPDELRRICCLQIIIHLIHSVARFIR